MNKVQFLNLLEKKLNIINETERQDILNEYEDYINQRLSHGESEEDIVSDFGSVDTLASELLDAYHISDEYINENTKSPNSYSDINNQINDSFTILNQAIKKSFIKTKNFGKKSKSNLENYLKSHHQLKKQQKEARKAEELYQSTLKKKNDENNNENNNVDDSDFNIFIELILFPFTLLLNIVKFMFHFVIEIINSVIPTLKKGLFKLKDRSVKTKNSMNNHLASHQQLKKQQLDAKVAEEQYISVISDIKNKNQEFSNPSHIKTEEVKQKIRAQLIQQDQDSNNNNQYLPNEKDSNYSEQRNNKNRQSVIIQLIRFPFVLFINLTKLFFLLIWKTIYITLYFSLLTIQFIFTIITFIITSLFTIINFSIRFITGIIYISLLVGACFFAIRAFLTDYVLLYPSLILLGVALIIISFNMVLKNLNTATNSTSQKVVRRLSKAFKKPSSKLIKAGDKNE